LYPFDQCIVFDGSYRVLSGQVPYQDFVLPFGPVAFWLQAVFFGIFGVSYFGYLMGAAVVNAVASLCAVWIVRMLQPRPRWLAYVAGLLTAVWFYPPFGTPWVDQTAFFFALLALGTLLWAIVPYKTGAPRALAIAGCGCLALLSFISKQNVGAFMLLLYPLAIAAAYAGDFRALLKRIGLFAAGFGASLAAFAAWVRLASDWPTFVRYFFTVPAQLGSERLHAFITLWFGTLKPFFGGRGPVVVNIMVWVSLLIALYVVVSPALRRSRSSEMGRRMCLSAVICLYLILFQHLFMNTTLNQPENALGFFGTIFALAMGLILGSIEGRVRIRAAITAGVAVGVVLASLAGVRVAMDRKVHDILRGSTYPRPVAAEGLKYLRWAQPTRMGGFDISEQSITGLYRYLKQKGENFFIFPDFTVFYGLLGKPSPQPVLWFHEGVTYAKGSNADLDERIVTALEANDVRVFVLEQVAWFNTGERLNAFPRTKAYLMRNFSQVSQIETFSVFEKVRD
jgi:hypothetical protein